MLQIVDTNGQPLFCDLIDNRCGILEFKSGFGFIDNLDIERNNWRIIEEN